MKLRIAIAAMMTPKETAVAMVTAVSAPAAREQNNHGDLQRLNLLLQPVALCFQTRVVVLPLALRARAQR